MTIGGSLGYPHPIPTISTPALPAEVGIAHEDIAALQTAALRRQRGRLRVRRWARPKW